MILTVKAEIVPATIEHAEIIAQNTRQPDIDELWASSCSSPLNAMKNGIQFGDFALTGLADGKPVCMWGVVGVSLIGHVGVPWMVGTKDLDVLAIPFLRHSRKAIASTFQKYKSLVNYVDQRNTKAIQWLKWLGFNIEKKAEPYGVYQLPFHRFDMRRV